MTLLNLSIDDPSLSSSCADEYPNNSVRLEPSHDEHLLPVRRQKLTFI
jgi:hypothetical protein